MAESILLGLDVVFRRSIPLRVIGWLRVAPLSGGGAKLEVDCLTHGMNHLECLEVERARAFSEGSRASVALGPPAWLTFAAGGGRDR